MSINTPTEPRLADHGGNMEKRWYIDYQVFNTDTQQYERKRYTGMNKFKTLASRKKESQKALKEIIKLLEDGYTTGTKPALEIDLNKVSILEGFNYAMAKKKSSLRPKSYQLYNTQLNVLKKFIEENGYQKIRFIDFKLGLLHEFLDYLKDKRKVANKTYNDYLTNFSTLFNFFIDRELIDKNPLLKIKKKKVVSGKHVPYTMAQLEAISEAILEEEDFQLLTFIKFIYYTLARPTTEIRFLKVGHIDKDRIHIPGELSKNGKGDYVKIPKGLETIINTQKLREYPPNHYIFSTSGNPGLEPVGINYFYKRNRKILDKLGLKDKDYDLYGYKHTGVINLFRAGVDIKAIQRQCRHSSIQQTDKYLKDLGLFENDSVVEDFPEF